MSSYSKLPTNLPDAGLLPSQVPYGIGGGAGPWEQAVAASARTGLLAPGQRSLITAGGNRFNPVPLNTQAERMASLTGIPLSNLSSSLYSAEMNAPLIGKQASARGMTPYEFMHRPGANTLTGYAPPSGESFYSPTMGGMVTEHLRDGGLTYTAGSSPYAGYSPGQGYQAPEVSWGLMMNPLTQQWEPNPDFFKAAGVYGTSSAKTLGGGGGGVTGFTPLDKSRWGTPVRV